MYTVTRTLKLRPVSVEFELFSDEVFLSKFGLVLFCHLLLSASIDQDVDGVQGP